MEQKANLLSAIAQIGSALTLFIASIAITPLCVVYLYEPKKPADLKNRLNKINNK